MFAMSALLDHPQKHPISAAEYLACAALASIGIEVAELFYR
jgi:hypothetical protein